MGFTSSRDFVFAGLELRLSFAYVTNKHVGIAGAYKIIRERERVLVSYCAQQCSTDNMLLITCCTYVYGCKCHIG